jgi:hypothetical protein
MSAPVAMEDQQPEPVPPPRTIEEQMYRMMDTIAQQNELLLHLQAQITNMKKTAETPPTALTSSFPTFPSFPTPPPPPPTKELKVHDPEEFDRTPTKLKQFLSQLNLVFQTAPQRFAQLHDKIFYTLSFMKGRTASAFREIILEEVNTAVVFPYASWKQFESRLKAAFEPIDPEVTAHQKIQALQQGNGTVEEYILLFNEQANKTGYNEVALIEQLKLGMNGQLVDKIHMMNPMPTTLEEWKKMAVILDRQWHARQQQRPARFQGNFQPSPQGNNPRFQGNQNQQRSAQYPPRSMGPLAMTSWP